MSFKIEICATSAEDLRLKVMEMAAQFLRVGIRDQMNINTGKVITTQEKIDEAVAKVNERAQEAKLPTPEETAQPANNKGLPVATPPRKRGPKPKAPENTTSPSSPVAPQSADIPLTPPADPNQLEMPVDQPAIGNGVVVTTKDDAIKALGALNEAKGFEEARAALESLGAKRMGELKPDQYHKLVDICKAKMG